MYMSVVRRRSSWPWRGPLEAPEGPPAAPGDLQKTFRKPSGL